MTNDPKEFIDESEENNLRVTGLLFFGVTLIASFVFGLMVGMAYKI